MNVSQAKAVIEAYCTNVAANKARHKGEFIMMRDWRIQSLVNSGQIDQQTAYELRDSYRLAPQLKINQSKSRSAPAPAPNRLSAAEAAFAAPPSSKQAQSEPGKIDYTRRR